jgi:hypothetical protein
MAEFCRPFAGRYGFVLSPITRRPFPIRLAFLLVCFLLVTARASGQTQQPFLVAVPSVSGQHGAVTFVRDDTTGVLTLVPNTTVTFVNPCGPLNTCEKHRGRQVCPSDPICIRRCPQI